MRVLVALALILNISWAADIVCDETTVNRGVAEVKCKSGELYCNRVLNKDRTRTYNCGLCPEGAFICDQCVGNAGENAKPCNNLKTPVGPTCEVTLNDGKTAEVNCHSSVKLCYSATKKDSTVTEYGCGLCPAEYVGEGGSCTQCRGAEGTGLACNADNSPGTMCLVTTDTDKGPISARCLFGNPYCYKDIDKDGGVIYGCGLCPDGSNDCKQCEGNDAKPCNEEGSPGGVICDVSIPSPNCFACPPILTPVTCKPEVSLCYNSTTRFRHDHVPQFTQYGCGECPREPFAETCTQCEGDKENPCNKGLMSPCEMPKNIDNGEMVEEIKSEDPDLAVNMAKYKCNQDYMMMETWKGDIGWCRHDGTYELPRCVKKDEWFKVEFELVSQNFRMKDAGRVKACYHYADGNKGDWYAGCDDHMNNPAAGAVCRELGFRYGRQIQPDRRMPPIENIAFKWTNMYCYHDDTLLTSESCKITDSYDEMIQQGSPHCFPDEQVTVHCFNDWWKVDVRFEMVERSGKMFCPVQVMKEGNEMKMKNMDIQVKWGGITMKEEDDYDAKYFEEGTDYQVIGGFSKKKGFRAKFIGDKSDYDCYFCDVYMDGNVMNVNSDKNHNCGAKFNALTKSGCGWKVKLECAARVLYCGFTCKENGVTSEQCRKCLGDLYTKCRCCLPFVKC